MSEGPAAESVEWIDRWNEGFGWIAHPDESMQRASHALATGQGVWVVDPIDAPGLDDHLAQFGEVAGVTVLLDRHKRDGAEIANRHDVPVTVPSFFDGIADSFDAPVRFAKSTLGETGYEIFPLVDSRFWQEAALYNEAQGKLVVPEAVGTADLFLAPGERLGVHPVLRLKPPRQLADLEPERLLVGHGSGIQTDTSACLRDAVASARRRAPRAYLRALRSAVG